MDLDRTDYDFDFEDDPDDADLDETPLEDTGSRPAAAPFRTPPPAVS
jgi:hypothetical protein